MPALITPGMSVTAQIDRTTSPRKSKPRNQELARKLRLMVEATSYAEVCRQTGIGRELLKNYLRGLPMSVITLRGVEAMIAATEFRIAADDDE